MTIIDKLSNKINQLEKDSQKRKMYEDIRTQLFIVCDEVARETDDRISDIITNIEFDTYALQDECRSIIFYTTLNNYEKKYFRSLDFLRERVYGVSVDKNGDYWAFSRFRIYRFDKNYKITNEYMVSPELFNSAIEAVVDRVSLDKHPLSKIAKDMGSAAQFTALTLIVLTWGIILI